MDPIHFRDLTPDDTDLVRWAIYEAITWSDDPDVPPIDTALNHPDLAMYHTDWGRQGDIGVVASSDAQPVGVAFARLFTDDHHGYGFVDEATPELGIAVDRSFRRRGIGRQLMHTLTDIARASGCGQLSLSVNNPNPSKRLYESLGYGVVADDGDSSVMVLRLDS